MTQPMPSSDEDGAVDLRRWALVALCLIAVGATAVTAGVWMTFGMPTALIVLGVLLLGGGIALGLMT